jgi:hypothetical protein
MLREITLDAREMEPPEPFKKSTAILAAMQPGEYYRLLHRRIPYPLFELCKSRKMDYCLRDGCHADYEVLIYFPCDHQLMSEEGLL